MSLTVVTAPPAIGGTGRPLAVRLSTNNLVTQTALTAIVVRNITANATAGQTMIFTLTNGVVITMTAATVPDGSGNQFTAGTTTLATLVADFQKNYFLNLYYIITTGTAPNRIIFTSRSLNGNSFNFTVSGTWGGNAAGTGNQTGRDKLVRPNFTAIADVWVENTYSAGDYGDAPVAKLAQTPDSNSGFVFDFSPVLDAYVKNILPSYNGTTVTILGGFLKRYLVFIGESYNVPNVVQAIAPLNSGLPLSAFRARLPQSTAAGNNVAIVPPFVLSGRGMSKTVTTDQREWILFLWDTDVLGTPTVNVWAEYTDNTSSIPTALTFTTTPLPQVYSIPAGYTQRAIAAIIPAKTVRKYFISITTIGTFTFTMADKCPPFLRYFVFRNELGGWDTLRCGGMMTKNLSTERESAAKNLPVAYQMSEAENWNHEVTGIYEYEISTGFLFSGQAEAEYYAQQFFLSEVVYWDVNSRFEPVQIISSEVRLQRDRQRMWGFSFRFRQGFRISDKRSNIWNAE